LWRQEDKVAEPNKTIKNAIDIINMINTGAQVAADLILLIRRNDGSIGVVALLDENDANFDANLKAATEWRAKQSVS
jgi:hypothetical protein